MTGITTSECNYHKEFAQGSQEWLDIRCGMLTASNVKHLFTAKLAPSKAQTAKTLMYELLAQRVTKYVEPVYVTAAMARGHDEEIIARDTYSKHFAPVAEVGFTSRWFSRDGMTIALGYSPDGLVDGDGLIEVKSRGQKWQMQTLVNGEIPTEYRLQMQTGMLVTGRKWCDFISICGGLPMMVAREFADEKLQAAIIQRVFEFEAELAEAKRAFEVSSKGMPVTERINYSDEMVF